MKKKEIIDNAINQIKNLHVIIENLKKERDDAKQVAHDNFQKQISKLTNENKQIIERLEYLTRSRDAIKEQIKELQSKQKQVSPNDMIEQRLEVAKNLIKSQQKEIKDLEQRNCDLLNTNKQLDEQFGKHSKDCSELITVLNNKITELEYERKQREAYLLDNSRKIEEKLKLATDAYEHCNNVRKELAKQVEELHEEVKETKISHYKKLIEEHTKYTSRDIDKLNKEIKKLTSENTKLKEELNKAVKHNIKSSARIILYDDTFNIPNINVNKDNTDKSVREVNSCDDCKETSCPIHPSHDI